MSNYGDNPPQSGNPYGEQPPAGYGQAPAYGQEPGGPLAGAPSPKGFIGALFDLSFTTFVTPMIIKVVYVIGLILIGLGTVFFAFSGFFGDSPALGVVTLIFAPIVGLLYLCLFRMMCEFYVAITRMSEDIHRRLPGR